jgi:hypothetical protein
VDIPEFQREFVWDPEQVKLLAESLYRDYPIGSFLLWDSPEYEEAKTARGTQASQWIIDGQQRTTALCLLLGMKPFWWPDAEDWNETLNRYDVMANLMPEGDEDRLEFALPNPIRRQDPRWVSVRSVICKDKVEDLTPLAQEITEQLNEPIEKFKLFTKVHAGLQRLWQIRERDIPIVGIAHEVEDVAEIFARLNREGTRVKEADVILALTAVRNPGWVREDYLPFRNDLEERGWDLDAGIFIRTMTGIGRGRARLREVPKNFWNQQNLRAVWKKAQTAISEVLKRLAEMGIPCVELVPSKNSLIPLFVLHNRWADKESYRFPKAFRWFLMANRDGRYSGAATTSLDEDLHAVTQAAGFDEALDRLFQRLRIPPKMDGSEFLQRYDRWGNRFQCLMMYITLFHRDAKDWVDGTRLGYDKTGTPITIGYQPQWHHIYPRKVLKKAGEKEDTIQALANFTVLNEKTNVSRLAGKDPLSYIRKFKIPSDFLRSHVVPEPFVKALDNESDAERQWAVEKYSDFLLDRAMLLANEANVFLANLEKL